MCGRYTLRKPATEVVTADGKRFDVHPPRSALINEPRFNIAPTQTNIVFIANKSNSDRLDSRLMQWGLIPSWSKTARMQRPIVNARSETIVDKPSFRTAYQRRRCLVPADGFYEWKKTRGRNQPFFFHLKSDHVFLMAGIWEIWQSELGERLESYAILTTRANALMSKYHDRMPVILLEDQIETWLRGDPTLFESSKRGLFFKPFDANLMECRAANPIVNNNRSEGEKCLETPIEKVTAQLDLGF